ncbi:hypothetical protein J4208_00785 [Candidatus Woesearchaeota archaeon]|nr:hypothetical protein [Candidatus Woesearchaeota archaeon]
MTDDYTPKYVQRGALAFLRWIHDKPLVAASSFSPQTVDRVVDTLLNFLPDEKAKTIFVLYFGLFDGKQLGTYFISQELGVPPIIATYQMACQTINLRNRFPQKALETLLSESS